MSLEEPELPLRRRRRGVPFQQFANHTQPVRAVSQSLLTGPINRRRVVVAGQMLEPDQDTHSLNPAGLHHRRGPLLGMWADRHRLTQQRIRAAIGCGPSTPANPAPDSDPVGAFGRF